MFNGMLSKTRRALEEAGQAINELTWEELNSIGLGELYIGRRDVIDVDGDDLVLTTTTGEKFKVTKGAQQDLLGQMQEITKVLNRIERHLERAK